MYSKGKPWSLAKVTWYKFKFAVSVILNLSTITIYKSLIKSKSPVNGA